MDDETFTQALEHLIRRREGKVRVKRVLRTARDLISMNQADVATREAAMDKVAIVAVQAIFSRSTAVLDEAVKSLYAPYLTVVQGPADRYGTRESAEYWLSIILRVFCIGAAAIREEAWWSVRLLVDRRIDDYYLVWLRHGLTMAARADLLLGRSREGALVLTLARELAANNSALRSDIGLIPPVAGADLLPDDDSMLDSLCQFDIAWCTYAVAAHPGVRDGQLMYPSCLALQQRRAQPMISAFAASSKLRHDLVMTAPFAEDTVIADALEGVLEVAVIQSQHFGSWWPGASADLEVERFLRNNATRSQ